MRLDRIVQRSSLKKRTESAKWFRRAVEDLDAAKKEMFVRGLNMENHRIVTAAFKLEYPE